MRAIRRVIFLVCADPALTQQFVSELVATGAGYQLPLAVSLAQARRGFRRLAPTVILLDESVVVGPPRDDKPREKAADKPEETLDSAVARLTEWAPVVVVAAPERQSDLTFLITSGAVDFVARSGNFLPVAVGFLERRVALAEQSARVETPSGFPEEAAGDFGEILRHEVNNPLTGILGNAELLLAEWKKRNGDSRADAAALQRLQTIAELAVRLRETVRRLSNAWGTRHDHARSA
jgi:signal transduction histidine kinase